jgi:hypothetical protein
MMKAQRPVVTAEHLIHVEYDELKRRAAIGLRLLSHWD